MAEETDTRLRVMKQLDKVVYTSRFALSDRNRSELLYENTVAAGFD